MKVYVSGSNGFLGKHVVSRLKSNNVQVVGGISYKKKSSQDRDPDLMNIDEVDRFLTTHTPDAIIHLAARVGGIGANRDNPGGFFFQNMQMGVNLIDSVRRNCNLKKFVFVSTTCAYPKYAPIPFKEEDIWNGFPEETNAPYGIAKKSLMLMGQVYKQQYRIPFTTIVPTNLYGPGDNFDLRASHVIPAVISKIAQAKKFPEKEQRIVLWGDGSPTRDFLYVESAADYIVSCIVNENIDIGKYDVYNIGSGQEISIRVIVERIAELMDYKGEIIWDETMPNGQPRRCLDTSRADEVFGNSVKQISIEDGLKKTLKSFYA